MKERRTDFLTDSLIASTPVEEKQFYIWDKATCGFGVRIGSSGVRSLVGKINFKDSHHSKWVTLKSRSVEEGRAEYTEMLRAFPDHVNQPRGWMK